MGKTAWIGWSAAALVAAAAIAAPAAQANEVHRGPVYRGHPAPGHVAIQPAPVRQWVPGHWQHGPHGRMWVGGHWVVAQPAYPHGGFYDRRGPHDGRHGGHFDPRGSRFDQDRDGIPNRHDRDIDGDGVPNWRDRAPRHSHWR